MSLKVLIVAFSDDQCRLAHALWYAKDLVAKGHTAKVILEGAATKCFGWDSEWFAKQLKEAIDSGVIAGTCAGATKGCGAADSDMTPKAEALNVDRLEDMHGHAGITKYLEEGYQVITL